MQPLDLDRVPNQPQPLPGSRTSLPSGMGDYLITLKEPTAPARRATRSDIFGQNLSLTSSFRRDLESWLDEHQLTREVAGIGEPNGFPVLALTCTPLVAKAIAEFPGVEWIVPDNHHALRMYRQQP